jgi:hypothetical protein
MARQSQARTKSAQPAPAWVHEAEAQDLPKQVAMTAVAAFGRHAETAQSPVAQVVAAAGLPRMSGVAFAARLRALAVVGLAALGAGFEGRIASGAAALDSRQVAAKLAATERFAMG